MKKLCPICTKQGKKQLSKEEFLEIKNNTDVSAMYGKICKDCKALMKESITIFCKKCPTIVMVNPDKVRAIYSKAKNGDIMTFTSCVKCSYDKKFHIG